MNDAKVVLLGGLGIKDSPLFEGCEWREVDTQLRSVPGGGNVSYQMREDGVLFIPRHGHGTRRYGPAETPYLANL